MDNLIREHLSYNSETGDLTWIKSPALRNLCGKKAGCLNENGYIHIIIKRKCFKAHRIAWFLYYGKWPEHEIDHADGNKINNKISNLRDLKPSENQQNRKCHREGVLWGTSKIQGGKYYSSRVSGVHLGNFKTREEAHACSLKYAKENGINIIKKEINYGS